MLSVGDSPANVPGQVDWSMVVHASGTEAPLVEVFFNNQGMRVVGTTGSGSVEIDLSHLPASVINLQISSFESVTLTGEASLHDLVVSDVKKIDAGHLTVERLTAYNVERVRIDNSPVEVWLEGAKDADGVPTLGGKTLFETDHFSTAPDALIYGFVESLGLMTSEHVGNLPLLYNGSTSQPVLMNFTPDTKPKMGGLAEANTIEGDFAKYFFSSRTEQVQLEKSSVVTARAALVQALSTQQLLGNPRLQAMLTDGLDATTAGRASTVTRPLVDASATMRADVGVNRPLEKVVDGSDAHAKTAVVDIALQLTSAPTDANAAAEHDANPMHVASIDTVAPIGSALSVTPTHESDRQGDTVLSALSLALARLSEPFVQTMTDLQGRSATFGQIVSARLTEGLRTDGRPALLVDARPATAKTRSPDEVVIVHV